MLSIQGHKYSQQEFLGEGTYGSVHAVVREDGKKFAFKRFINEVEDLELGVLRELSIMNIFKGNKSGLMDLQDVIVDAETSTVGVVMKKYPTDLQREIQKGTLTKHAKRKIAKRLLQSVAFMHRNGIIHRDIKPENVMLDEKQNPVLADFSLSKVFTGFCMDGTHTGRIATATYRAPEVVAKKAYGLPVDAWSLGVVFYEMFTGTPIRTNKDSKALCFLNKESKKIKDTPLGRMVRGLLIRDPALRWTPTQALASEMFHDDTVPQLVWTPKKLGKVDDEVHDVCTQFETEKLITRWAAQTYVNATGCSVHSAVTLAYKVYETIAMSVEDDEYVVEEMEIVQRMEYNVFV